ncbi:MAG TPA: serine/threonine-protein kinase [Pseudomonadota bacterium]|nr:serine/threonine-protein kinase [Pseudomonadota bacterium]
METNEIEQCVDNYVLLRFLGRGSMGAVYEARHRQIERRVAIKVLRRELADDPEILQRFTNEARIVNIIGHAGLVSISEQGQTRDGGRYIVMEYVDGITLRDYLAARGGQLPVPDVLRLVRQVASTLAAAHAKQIVHRDLKPANIMLVRESDDSEVSQVGDPSLAAALPTPPPEGLPEQLPEKIKILDFGIAKSGLDGIGQTRTGAVMGTPIYMSPEQCRSGRNAIDRSDVYALGVIAYELLTGAPPFQGGAAVLMAAHLMQEPPSLLSQAPHVPTEIAKLVHRMLEKSPSDRPSAAEVARQLAERSGARTTASQAYAILPSERSGHAASSKADPMADESDVHPEAQSALHAVPLRLRGKLVAAAALFLLLLAGLLVLLLWTLARQPVSTPTAATPRGRSLSPPGGRTGEARDGGASRADGGADHDGGRATASPTKATTSPDGSSGTAVKTGSEALRGKTSAGKPSGAKPKKKAKKKGSPRPTK